MIFVSVLQTSVFGQQVCSEKCVEWEVCVDYGLLVKCQCCETDDGRKCKLQWCHRPSAAASPGGDADRIHR